jgi:glycosyltransferase involved in cell wall biosynthesis
MSVTIIVTCFNEEKFIEQAILSILNQTRLDLIEKIIVVDDGSSDRSVDIIENISILDKRIEFIKQNNSGLAIARNNALRSVATEWVCFMDGDDIWPDDKIEKQMHRATLERDVSLVYADSYRFGTEERYIRARTLPQSQARALVDYFLNDAPILSSLLIRMNVFVESGFFNPELPVAQDTEMWTRAVAGYKTAHIKEPLLFRRMHPSSLGANFDQKSKYLDLVTDKIVRQFPQLQPYRHIKDAMIRFEHARRHIHSGNRTAALRQVVAGLRRNPRSAHGYAVLAIALLPFSGRLLKLASAARMWLLGADQKCRIPVPHYDRQRTAMKLRKVVE